MIGGSSCYLRLDGQVFFLSCLGEKANALALISALTVPFSQGTNTREKLVGYLKVPLLCLVTNHQLLGMEVFKLNNYLFFCFFCQIIHSYGSNVKKIPKGCHFLISPNRGKAFLDLFFVFVSFPFQRFLKHLQSNADIYSSPPTFIINGSILCTLFCTLYLSLNNIFGVLS